MTNTIRQRLNIVFICLAIVPLLIVGSIVAWQSFNTLEQQTLNLQREIVKGVLAKVTAFFDELENELRFVSNVQTLKDVDLNVRNSILKSLMVDSVYNNLVMLDNQRQELIHLSRLDLGSMDGGKHEDADKFVIPEAIGDVYYSPVRFDEEMGEPLITIAVPLVDLRTGRSDGVLAAEVRLKIIWNLIAEIKVGEGHDVYIVDSQGRVVAHRNPSIVLRGTTFDLPDQDGIQSGLTGERVVLVVDMARFGNQEFNVVAEETTSEAFTLAYNSVRVTVALIAAALLLAGILGFFIVRQIIRPIESMAKTAHSISSGDLSKQVEINKGDELGVLAEAFNSMTKQLRSLIDGLEQQVADRTAKLEAAQMELLRQERLATLGKVTATVAHEIRNPLATVNTSVFSIASALERNEPERVKRALNLAERNVIRCDNIIAELLDYTRKLDVRLDKVNIDSWLKNLLDELTYPDGIECRQNLTCGMKVPVDRELLRRAIINIITNAVHALTEENSPGNVLTVETSISGRDLEIRIVDTGPGIPDELREKIFEPLFSTKGFGVGLGLSIAQDIMEKHQGDIEVQSEVGKGTTVILRISLEDRESA